MGLASEGKPSRCATGNAGDSRPSRPEPRHSLRGDSRLVSGPWVAWIGCVDPVEESLYCVCALGPSGSSTLSTNMSLH